MLFNDYIKLSEELREIVRLDDLIQVLSGQEERGDMLASSDDSDARGAGYEARTTALTGLVSSPDDELSGNKSAFAEEQAEFKTQFPLVLLDICPMAEADIRAHHIAKTDLTNAMECLVQAVRSMKELKDGSYHLVRHSGCIFCGRIEKEQNMVVVWLVAVAAERSINPNTAKPMEWFSDQDARKSMGL